MRLPWLALTAFAAFLLWYRPSPGAAPPPTSVRPPRPRPIDVRALDAAIHSALRIWHVPGLAVAIVSNGEVVYLKGHGVREVGSKAAVTPDTLFPIASCTKAFTTLAIALLVDEGKMNWDDPVRQHLPWFRLSDPLADREVRMRDLVCHRTGLSAHNLLWYRAPWSQEESVRRLALLPLDRPFRSAFQYQSGMFTAAGLATARVADMPWGDFVKQRLFRPLGMTGAVCTSTEALAAVDHATPHQLNQRGRAEIMERNPMPEPNAAGSIHSGASDLAKWMIFQMGDGTANGKRIVSAAALEETHRPQIVLRMRPIDKAMFPDTLQISYALGWSVHDYRGLRLVAHGGATDGFRAQVTMAPDVGVGIVLLGNLHQTHMNQALSNCLLDIVLGMPRKDWHGIHRKAFRKEEERIGEHQRELLAGRRHGTRPSCSLNAYVGDYEHPAYGKARVLLRGGALVWHWHDFAGPLEHFHYDTFVLRGVAFGPAQVSFTLDGSGTPTGMKVGGNLNVEFRRGRPGARRE